MRLAGLHAYVKPHNVPKARLGRRQSDRLRNAAADRRENPSLLRHIDIENALISSGLLFDFALDVSAPGSGLAEMHAAATLDTGATTVAGRAYSRLRRAGRGDWQTGARLVEGHVASGVCATSWELIADIGRRRRRPGTAATDALRSVLRLVGAERGVPQI